MVVKIQQNIFYIITIIILIIIIAYLVKAVWIKKIYKTDYNDIIENCSQKYGIEKELIFAIIKTESNFDDVAVSGSNAKGLMQIMPSTAKEVANTYNINLTDDNIFEPEINIEIGTIYFSQLLQKYNNIELALAAYNAGYGNVDKWINQNVISSDGSDIEKIPFKETNNYVRKVMRDYKIYKKLK